MTGRKPKGAGKRSIKRTIAFSPAEDVLLGQLAARTGLPKAMFVRRAALGCIIYERITAEDNALLKWMYKIGNNINQLVVELRGKGYIEHIEKLDRVEVESHEIYEYFKKKRDGR